MSTAVAVRRGPVVAGLVASLAAQVVMIVVGVWAVFFSEDTDDLGFIGLLFLWCLVGTLYEVVALIALSRSAKQPTTPGAPPARLEVGRLARFVATTATILASLVGFTAAFQVLGPKNDPDVGALTDLVGVWAMLLAWGFLHWGFAQGYYQRFYSASTPPLDFPRTATPRLVDFVYFAFTLGTSFAASDVQVRTSRMRWTVTWHSVLSFFFNGLIIVLALNTIMSSGR